MKIVDLINNSEKSCFSFEILPPPRGNNIDKVFKTIDTLKEFDPKYINITTHRSQYNYVPTGNGLYKRVNIHTRPGTVAIAAAIQNRYGIRAVPHIICSGVTKSEIENSLIDLNYIGITDLLVLRGDKAKHEANFTPVEDGYSHAIELQEQVNNFNKGQLIDGTYMDVKNPFSYGVACYPEKHEESPNMEQDIKWVKAKVQQGADYVVTQMFFDNQKYFNFVERCREEGITVPIIPGLKPIGNKKQLTILPKVFHVDLPDTLATELANCKDDIAAKELGVEWCAMQAKELIDRGVPSLHFYTLMATESVRKIAERVY